jgi:hypothetical protein
MIYEIGPRSVTHRHVPDSIEFEDAT